MSGRSLADPGKFGCRNPRQTGSWSSADRTSPTFCISPVYARLKSLGGRLHFPIVVLPTLRISGAEEPRPE
jgi:hypothetical protein